MPLYSDIRTGLAAGIRNFFCRQPFVLTPLWQPPGLFTFPQRLGYEAVCGRPALPARDPIPDAFCAGTFYRVTAQVMGTNGFNEVRQVATFQAPFVLIQRYINPTGFNRTYVSSLRPAGATNDDQDGGFALLPAGGVDYMTSILEVVPLTSEESCGTPVPEEPFPVPVPPPITVNIGDLNITLGDFNTTVVFSPTVTFYQPQLDVNYDLQIPVTIDIAPNLVFPGGTRFPALYQVGPNILNTNIAFNPSFRIGRLALNIGGTFNEAEGGESTSPDEFEEILRENIATKALKPPAPLVLLGTLALGDSGVQPLPERARELRIISTRSVLETRRESGGQNAPEVNYLGWVSFGGTSDSFGERFPISYESASYPIPLGSLSCLFTLTRGATGRGEIWGDEG